MNKIILIGCGRAGQMHAKCYAKIIKSFNIEIAAVIDQDPEKLNRFKVVYDGYFNGQDKPLFATSLNDIANRIDFEDAIVDICVPNDCHYPCAREACDLGVKTIIIEKPLADTILDAERIEDLNTQIVVAENYIFSKVTEKIKEMIEEKNLKPRFVRTEFSKDRRMDSSNRRGSLNNGAPHVFTVELPHQIAIVNYIFGDPIDIFWAWCDDMIVEDKRLYEHGEGAIFLGHKDNIVSYNFSCLEGHKHLPLRYRGILIHCEDNIKIIGHYPCGGDDSFYGSIILYNNNQVVEKYDLIDDTISEMLKKIINGLDENIAPATNATFGRNIVDIINKGIQLARSSI